MLNTPEQLKIHITEYYKNVFGKVELAHIHLEPDVWSVDRRVSSVKNDWLITAFSFEELDFAIKEMKNNTARVLTGLVWSSLNPFGVLSGET